jgi:hypothetical protein
MNTKDLINKAKIAATLKSARELVADSDYPQRVANQVCKCCQYVNKSKIALQKFCTVKCERCDGEMQFSSSDVDKYHIECAKIESCCKRCGASFDVDADLDAYNALKGYYEPH